MTGWFRRRRRDQDLEDEIRSHLEMATRERVERGEAPALAAASSRREFGNVTLVKEVTREIWGGATMERFRRDLAYGVRQMVRHPGLSIVVVLTLALGIGGTTAIFSLVNAMVLEALPYADAGRLVSVSSGLASDRDALAPGPHLLVWRERSTTIEGLEAYNPTFATITGHGEAERLNGIRASAGFLQLLGVEPSLGRHFLASEDAPDGAPAVILGHDLWERRFGADPDVIGRTATLDDRPMTIVGVLPPGFRFLHHADFWVPLRLNPAEEGVRYVSNVRAVGRLRPGVTAEAAGVELETIRRHYEDSKPPGRPILDGSARVAPLHDAVLGQTRRLLFVLLGAVGLLLLIACANVANLLLSRAIARQREFAVRTALGAGRLRLVRQMLTESLLLAAAGGATGLMAAVWLSESLTRLAAPQVGPIGQVASAEIDMRVLAFAFSVSLLTAVLSGLVPAIQLSRPDLTSSLRGTRSDNGARGRRLRQLLTVAQVALTVVLLAGAGLLLRSFVTLLQVDPGYRPESVLTLRITLPEARYPQRSHRAGFYQALLQRTSSLPGVESAALVNHPPLTRSSFGGWLYVPGRPGPTGDQPPDDPPTPIAIVSPEYFRTMGIPLRAGRLFDERDRDGAPRVVVFSEALAQQLFPGEDPIGKRVWVPGPGEGIPTVIGIVGDIRHEGLDKDVMAQVYAPLGQSSWSSMTLAVRSSVEPVHLAGSVRAQVLALDPQLPLYDVKTMEQRLAESIAPRRVNLLLIGAFAVLALTLAAVGVYGVMAYAVTHRTREIGVRVALGATRADILSLIAGQGIRLVFAGAALGLFGAWALTRLMAGLLFGTSATDPLAFGGAVVVLILVALVACLLPARRALPIDPMVALRSE